MTEWSIPVLLHEYAGLCAYAHEVRFSMKIKVSNASLSSVHATRSLKALSLSKKKRNEKKEKKRKHYAVRLYIKRSLKRPKLPSAISHLEGGGPDRQGYSVILRCTSSPRQDSAVSFKVPPFLDNVVAYHYIAILTTTVLWLTR